MAMSGTNDSWGGFHLRGGSSRGGFSPRGGSSLRGGINRGGGTGSRGNHGNQVNHELAPRTSSLGTNYYLNGANDSLLTESTDQSQANSFQATPILTAPPVGPVGDPLAQFQTAASKDRETAAKRRLEDALEHYDLKKDEPKEKSGANFKANQVARENEGDEPARSNKRVKIEPGKGLEFVEGSRELTSQFCQKDDTMAQMASPTPENFGAGYGFTLGSGIVNILVGPTKQLFQVHRHPLCAKVPYFEKMFHASESAESAEGKATLPEDDPLAFSMFLEWVYVGRYSGLKTAVEHLEKSIQTRIRLYIMADKWCLPSLMDATMSMIISIHSSIYSRFHNTFLSPTLETLNIAYSHSGTQSKLRLYMSALVAFYIVGATENPACTSQLLSEILASNKELVYDIIRPLRLNPEGGSPVPPNQVVRCKYHVHDENIECPYP